MCDILNYECGSLIALQWDGLCGRTWIHMGLKMSILCPARASSEVGSRPLGITELKAEYPAEPTNPALGGFDSLNLTFSETLKWDAHLNLIKSSVLKTIGAIILLH